jgi:site-specific recombinase XerD
MSINASRETTSVASTPVVPVPVSSASQPSDVLDLSQQEQPYLSIDQLITLWIHEKFQNLSHSTRTQKDYLYHLNKFRDVVRSKGYDLFAKKEIIAMLAQAWANLPNARTGKEVSSATRELRYAVISSFYTFCIRKQVYDASPITLILRGKVENKQAARPLDVPDIRGGLDKIDTSTIAGKRAYALLSLAPATGRRVQELANLRRKHLHFLGSGSILVIWERCKEAKQMEDLVKGKTAQALLTYLDAIYPQGVKHVTDGEAPLWVSFSPQNAGQPIGAQTICDICDEVFGTKKFHL